MTGIATVSEGEALNWYGGGKTELTTSSNLAVTYGAKTEVVVGFKNDFSLATQTGISVGSKFEASLALEMSVKKNAEVKSAKDGEFYCTDTYVGTVGASAAQLAAIKTLRTATFILLGSQTAAMLLATVNATTSKVMSPESKEEIKVPGTEFNLGYMTSIFTIAATIAPALMVVYAKLKGLGENNNPNGVFSMDTVGTIFLGTRDTVSPNATSGVLVDTNKVQLSSSPNDLGYNRQEGPSVLGFQQDAGGTQTGGSRLEVRKDGTTAIFGKSFTANLVDPLGSPEVNFNAPSHRHIVTYSVDLDPLGPEFILDADGGRLQYGRTKGPPDSPNNSVAVTKDGVSALVSTKAGLPGSGSALRLTQNDASMGAAGNNLTINNTGVTLTYGQSKVQISAAGISVGDALTVMNPTAPGVSFTGLQKALLDIKKLQLAALLQAQKSNLKDKKFKALDAADRVLKASLVRTRNLKKTIEESASSKQ